MDYQFDQFDTECFRTEPRRTVLGSWTVEHVSFGTPATNHRTPLVFIGGAFQNAWSFFREVKHFFTQRPIVIVDLPGQGQNNQLSGELGFSDLANLLARFLDEVKLERIIPVGLSYGSGIAFSFAQQHPTRVDRLVLGGTTEHLRPRVDKALRAGFWYFDHGKHDAFADAVIHHLLNLPQREHTGVSDQLIDKLRLGMLELNDIERTRYRHNTARLFRDRLSGTLDVPTLVFTSRYDHFTAPFEGMSIADCCTSGRFAMIEGGDHLVPIENPKSVIALYDAFLNDAPLAGVPGVLIGDEARAQCKERRMLERRPGRLRDALIKDHAGREWTARLIDYNAHGCLLKMPSYPLLEDDAEPHYVSVPSIGAKGDAVLLPANEGARAIFLHDAFGSLGKLPVATVEVPVPTVAEHPAPRRRISLAERLVSLSE